MKVTPLGYALIGLIIARPRSGYDLRKAFEDSPLGVYSSSPGSIYPVLAKLADAGMIEKRAITKSTKSVFHPTTKGRSELKKWLSKPVTVNEIAKEIDITLLRFAFLESLNDLRLTQTFLESFEDAVSTHLENLNAFLETTDGKALSPYGRLAMENGMSGFEGQLSWAARAKATLLISAKKRR